MVSFKEFLKDFLLLESLGKDVFASKKIVTEARQKSDADYDEDDEEFNLDDYEDRYGKREDPDEDSDEDSDEDREDGDYEDAPESDDEDGEDDAANSDEDIEKRLDDIESTAIADADEAYKVEGKNYYNSEWENKLAKEYQRTTDPDKKREISAKLFGNKRLYIISLVNKLYPMIEPYLKGHDKDVKTKADVLSEANMIFIKLLDTFDPSRGNLTTYLKTNMVPRLMNLARTSIKAGKGVNYVSVDDSIKQSDGDKDQTIGDIIGDPNSDFAGNISKDEMSALLIDLLKELPKESRRVVEMMYPKVFGLNKEPMTYQQIADKLGKNNAASAKHVMNMIFAKLRDRLKEYGITSSPV